ncbi:MAG TPA: TIGR00366 family protein, partial [Thermovirgaceae bacterium]|nr:TIGR00366 family protein [Thermovirgaceae bacterium]
YVLIFCIILIAAVATYIIPAGVYDRVTDPNTGRTVVDAASFKNVPQNPIKPFAVMQAIPKGMNEAGWIIFLIFIIGGSFGMINGTGAIETGIAAMVRKLSGKEKILIPVTMLIFSLGGATFGMAESTLIFIPMGVVLARGLGFDALVGMSMVTIGALAGFAGGALNPFTVGVAQGIAGLPLFSGMGLRWITQLLFWAVGSFYILRYAMKIKSDPAQSIVYELEQTVKEEESEQQHFTELTTRQKLVLLIVVVGFGFIIYGVTHGWSTSSDLTATFLTMGILSGLVGGNSPGRVATDFIEGARSLTFGALVVGLTRGIVVVMESGQIIDTIIHAGAQIVTFLPRSIAAVAMLAVQSCINFFINSGSGQAAATMPIMAPLADVVGLTRQTAVLAFHMGDGLSNSLFPTSGVLMAGLSIAKIPYEKWVKYILPLMVALHLVAAAMMVVAAVTHYGPF